MIDREFDVLTAAAFLMAHPGCGGDVELRRGPGSLVCWCERCEDLRTFELVGEAPEERPLPKGEVSSSA